jgi:Arc/MetJ-type ribon-helix-helix transcriptional regulator
MKKERVTVSIDADLAAAGAAAVQDGRAESVSAWVNQALRDKASKDRRLAALAEAVAAYEAEHGLITEDELAQQARLDRDAAAAVRAGAKRRRRGAA